MCCLDRVNVLVDPVTLRVRQSVLLCVVWSGVVDPNVDCIYVTFVTDLPIVLQPFCHLYFSHGGQSASEIDDPHCWSLWHPAEGSVGGLGSLVWETRLWWLSTML